MCTQLSVVTALPECWVSLGYNLFAAGGRNSIQAAMIRSPTSAFGTHDAVPSQYCDSSINELHIVAGNQVKSPAFWIIGFFRFQN